MAAVDLPIEALLQQLAQIPLQGQSAVGPNTGCHTLIGFVPPCVDACDASAQESKLRGMHEQFRPCALAPCLMDAMAAQLILLTMRLNAHVASALAWGVAARRAGAIWAMLRGVVRPLLLLHGLPGSKRGDEFLEALVEREHKDRVAAAVAA